MPVVGIPAFRTGMVGYFVLAESTLGKLDFGCRHFERGWLDIPSSLSRLSEGWISVSQISLIGFADVRCVGPPLAPSLPAFGSSVPPTQFLPIRRLVLPLHPPRWKDKASGANAVGFRMALSGWDGWLRFSWVLHGTHRRDCHGHQAFAGLILAVAVKTCRESLFNLVGSAFVCNGFLCYSLPFRWRPYVPTAEFCRVPARVGTKGLAFD
ncbi:hypothetical protein DM860_017933 [Cuscuta australis]|uniref:Uncharacterized protein n=1 Tax=Cuscuta australis TaxID=267555 RepID=A0A328DZ10_9ASTE|nr:hypothetical protein DM860_017933 [Cuscuta australis]